MKKQIQPDVIEFIDESLELASHELLQRFESKLDVVYKSDSSFVTNADLASEKVIIERISKYFPEDEIISEEAGAKRSSKKPGLNVWVIDPLDGTTNYANGYPFYSISIARGVYDKTGNIQVLAGGICDPTRKKSYLATLSGGAFCNGKKLSVRRPREFDKTFLVTGFYYYKGEVLDNEIRRFQGMSQLSQSIRRDGSAALDLALVAAGVFDAFWEKGLALWDIAAGALLVTESGGILMNYPEEKSTSLDPEKEVLSYKLGAEGIIAGVPATVGEIYRQLCG